MDADFQAFHQDALNEVTCLLGSDFLYKGNAYVGVINDLELSSENLDGGLLLTIGTVIVVPRAALPVEPKAGEVIYVGTRKLRIEKVKLDEIAYEIACVTGAK